MYSLITIAHPCPSALWPPTFLPRFLFPFVCVGLNPSVLVSFIFPFSCEGFSSSGSSLARAEKDYSERNGKKNVLNEIRVYLHPASLFFHVPDISLILWPLKVLRFL